MASYDPVLFTAAVERGLEGIAATRADSPCGAERITERVKAKTPAELTREAKRMKHPWDK